MWLYMIAVAVVVIGLLGGIAMGGIFTLVLVPLGLIALFSALAHAMLVRSAQTSVEGGEGGSRVDDRPLARSVARDSGHAPTDPEALVNARREQQ